MFEPLLWSLLFIAAQSSTAPSIPQQTFRPGLYEVTSSATSNTRNHTGSAGPSGSATETKTTKERMCITPQTAPTELLRLTSRLCTPSNVLQKDDHISMDLSCNGMSSHVDTQRLTPTLTRITLHTVISNENHTAVVDGTSEYRFLSTSCGSLQPGQRIPVQ